MQLHYKPACLSSGVESAVIAALAEGVNTVINCESFQEAAKAVFHLCKKILAAECGYVALLDAETQYNQPMYMDAGKYGCTVAESVPMPLRGLREIAYKTKQVVIENDFAQSEDVDLLPVGHAEIRNILFAPLLVNGEAVGLLGLANKQGGFTDADVRIAKAFGDLVSLALYNSHKMETIKSNKTKLRQLADEAIAEAARREKAEEELRQSQREIRSILDNIPDIVSRFDKNHRYLFTNAAIETITNRTRDYFLGKSHDELEKKSVYPLWDSCLRTVFETGKETVFEFEYDHGGGMRYYQVKFTPEPDDNGEVKSVLTVNRDITERVLFHKQKEEALQAENKLFTSGPVVVFKRQGGFDGSLEYLSPNVREQFGYGPQDFIAGNIRFRDLVHPEDAGTILTIRENIEAGRPFVEAEHRIKRADGQYRWVYNYFVPERDGKGVLTAWRGYLFDVTDRKAAEQAIAVSERKYRDLVEDANVIILHLDSQGRVLFINDFGLNFFGYEAAEVLNRSVKGTILPHFESTGRDLWNGYDDIFSNPAGHERVVIENVKKDGRRVWVKWSHRVSSDPHTGELRLLTVGVDITARLRAERELKYHHEQERRQKAINDVLEKRIGEEEFWATAGKAGIHLLPPVVCFIAKLDIAGDLAEAAVQESEWQSWKDTAVGLISIQLDCFAWHDDNEIAVLKHYKSGRFSSEHWARRIAKIVGGVFRNLGFTLGASEPENSIKAAYQQAREAVMLGPVGNSCGRIHCWRDLGMSKIIYEQANSKTGAAFIREWLGALKGANSPKEKEWLMTLKELVSGDTIKIIAKRLNVHPKTIAFRKRKIELLLGKELSDPETRLNIAVALKLSQLEGKCN